jgi:hypothetical protein
MSTVDAGTGILSSERFVVIVLDGEKRGDLRSTASWRAVGRCRLGLQDQDGGISRQSRAQSPERLGAMGRTQLNASSSFS